MSTRELLTRPVHLGRVNLGPRAAAADSAGCTLQTRLWHWVLPLATLLLMSVVFRGMNWTAVRLDWWFLTFVCLAPWVFLTITSSNRRTAYLSSYLLGIVFYLVNTYYLWGITRVGYVALSIYFGIYFLFVAIVLRAVHRRLGVPMTLAVPVVWVAGEIMRGIGPLAFPFLFLSHGVHRQLALIQVSDLIGAYGVSFAIAMVNGFLVDCALHYLRKRNQQRPTSLFIPAMIASAFLSAVLLYGVVRLGRQGLIEGPRVAVLQADYPLSVNPDARVTSDEDKAAVYMELMAQADKHDPDLILFPETPWTMYLNDEFLEDPAVPGTFEFLQRTSRAYDQRFRQLAAQSETCIVVGAGSLELFPTAVYPKYEKYNSAFSYFPDGERKERYDKAVLVMFGEYTPFRYGRLHSLYRWLDTFNPFSTPEDEFSLTPGSSFSTQEMRTSDRVYRFGIPICFEDLIPRVSREFALGADGGKEIDFLLSISNDGWFNHGSLVPQHLAVCALRAVENRVGIARSVNTACSGFIDPDGLIHDVVKMDGRALGPGIFGYEVATVMIDPRLTIYTLYGDWFGALCIIVSALLWLVAILKPLPATNSKR